MTDFVPKPVSTQAVFTKPDSIPAPITIQATTPAVFNLPYLVAEQEGYFRDEGLDIRLLRREGEPAPRVPIELVKDHRDEDAFSDFEEFEAGTSSVYRACEWGQIRRAHDSKRQGQIVHKRAAVASQAIIVRPDSPINVPQDLANVPVGVSFHHGSHYLALQTLEGFLERDRITLIGVKGLNRFRALQDGHLDAVAVMEPWITVAEKLGYKVIAEAHYIGSEIASPDLSDASLASINRAVARAVRQIRQDIRPYLHHLIAEVPEDIVSLSPADFRIGRLRYIEPASYPKQEFEATFNWMVGWGLIPSVTSYGELVDNRATAAS